MNSRAVEQNWETSIRRRTLQTFVLLLGTTLSVLGGAGSARAAAAAQPARPERVDVTVVEVSGLVDRIQARFLRATIARGGTDVIVVRLDSGGSVVSEEELVSLERAIQRSEVPVTVWIGPGRDAKAEGASARIVRAAALTGGTPGVDTGGVGLDVEAPTLGDFILALDGREGIAIPTETVRREGRPPQRELAEGVVVSFAEPPFTQQLLHAVSTPTAAYLLVTIAVLLFVFEFFTGGIGVAGAVAVVCLVMGGFGLGALPTRPLGLCLLVVGTLGYAIDVQVGVPRAWTVIGTVAYAVGSLFLFDGVSVPIVVLAAVLAGVVVFMVAAMPAVVRTRYSTPTIGRESMVGEEGTAATDVAPTGVVTVRDAPWRARTNRATPIKAGAPVKVVAIDGLLLEVEPLEGAARDYRERGAKVTEPDA